MQSLLHRLPLRLFVPGLILTIWSVQASARTDSLLLERHAGNLTGHPAVAINGQLPASLVRFNQGENVIVRAERRLVGGNVEGRMGHVLPQLCALGQAICVLVAPQTTYKANWHVYQKGGPVEVLCVENSTKEAAYVVSRPQSERPPEIELEEGLKFCSPLVS